MAEENLSQELFSQELEVKTLYGASPEFPYAGRRYTVKYSQPKLDYEYWGIQTQNILQALSQKANILNRLSVAFAEQRAKSPSEFPLLTLVNALLQVYGLSNYPLRIELSLKQHTVILYCAVPYKSFMNLALKFAIQLVTLGHSLGVATRLSLAPKTLQQWLSEYQSLPSLIPSTEVKDWHYKLWLLGETWQWQPGQNTILGQASLRRVTTKPEKLSRESANERSIPIYTVTGSVGKTTTARLLSQLLAKFVPQLALTASDGIWIGKEKLAHGDCIGGRTAQWVLLNSQAQAAVFEQGRGGIVKQGVPYAHTEVGILLNIQPVHLGLDGIETLEQMASVKALGIAPARLAVLNYDDPLCRAIGEQRQSGTVIGFSTVLTEDALRDLSCRWLGAVGVLRQAQQPKAILVYEKGQCVATLSLEGVAPYHGLLGEKTLEELLAVIAASHFGPIKVNHLQQNIRALNLDNKNHVFRTSVHQKDRVTFVLDKAAELASLKHLGLALNELKQTRDFTKTLMVMARSAGEPRERHQESARLAYGIADEFLFFDRSESYTLPTALVGYSVGDIPRILQEIIEGLNAQNELEKPSRVFDSWSAVEAYLTQYFASMINTSILVVINQPATSVHELNRKILKFVNTK